MLNRELCISQRQLWEKNKRQEKYINNNIKLFAEVTRVRRAFHMQQKYIDAREKKEKKERWKAYNTVQVACRKKVRQLILV